MSASTDAAPEAPPADRRRKFLVVVDDTPECDRAVLYAGRRAARTNAGVVALCVAEVDDAQHWLGVEDVMRAEAEEEAEDMLDRALDKLSAMPLAMPPERKVVIGKRTDAIRKAIAEDPAIAVLVLAAAPGSEGPGPLVTAIAGAQAGAYPIPITIVPGGLSDAEIEAIAG